MLRLLLSLAVASLAAIGSHAQETSVSLLDDPAFSQVTADYWGKWEIRYALKASEPTSRPKWLVVPRVDDMDAARGQYVSVEKDKPAAGSRGQTQWPMLRPVAQQTGSGA